MRIVINHILGIGIASYIIYQLITVFKFKVEIKQTCVKIMIASISFSSLFFIDTLSQLNTVFLSRILVLACLVAFAVTLTLMVRKSPYFIAVSVVTIILIYLTMQSVLITSSDVTSDPNSEILTIDPNKFAE
ncbi:MAG: hypothetical protein ACRDCC_10835 [Culicoidibacterales bacterium]